MLISAEEALKVVLGSVRPLQARNVALGKAVGCCLAQSVRCDRDQPPADRSAMDGYAVAAADVGDPPVRLRVIGEVAAGSSRRPRVKPGCCVAILTGGNMPPGADAVVPVEYTRVYGRDVAVLASFAPGDHVRRRGEEARRGQLLLPKGTRLGPVEIGLCAMVGQAEVKVHARPTVAVLCTGAEVRKVSDRVAAHELRDSNGPALLAALAEAGFGEATCRVVPDDPGLIARHLTGALRTRQVVLVSGGVSVGRYDYVPQAVRRIGGRIRFHGVNMKPGRPQLYATLPGERHVFGLPGNPLSALTGLWELALPALRRLSGARREDCRPAVTLPLAEPMDNQGDRVRFRLARLVAAKGGLAVAAVASKGSADLIAAAGADGVVVLRPSDRPLPAGATVEFHPWRLRP